MSAEYRLKKFVSIVLILCILVTWLPVNTVAANDSSIIDTRQSLAPEEASFISLISQLGTEGISLRSAMSEGVVISPSGTDHRIRISYEIEGLIYADYESEKTATIRFRLSSPSEQEVSFTYTIYSGSAYPEHFSCTEKGTVTFGAGETEKVVEINIPKLINNPTLYGTASNPWEFWTGDRIFYVNCSNISNALFDNEKDSMTIPVSIKNQFDFKKSYENAAAAYLVDLSELSGVESFPDTPGKFLNTGNEIRLAEESTISADVRVMLDMDVFSHVNMPVGYFFNENAATGEVLLKIDKIYSWGSFSPYYKNISIDESNRTDFNLGDKEIWEIGLGPLAESNGVVQALSVTLDYSTVTGAVYTCFNDQNDVFIEKQMNFSDNINPYVARVSLPEDSFFYGENIPITVTYNEPVLADGISIKANSTVLYPMEAAGTISNSVSFLYEINEDYAGSIEVTDITGAVDLSGKAQEAAAGYTFTDAALSLYDPGKALSYLGDTTVIIDQGESINAKGEITINIKENLELTNWFSDKIQENRLLSAVKAKVIGEDGNAIDVPLYVNDGPMINKLWGEFTAPANLTDQTSYYAAEIYIDKDNSGEFKLLYGLSEEYAILPIVYIDDETDLEITYTNWPSDNRIFTDNKTPISLGYNVKNNATWQSPKDFSWSSSDETVAAITATGDIALTGQVGEVTFTLTALNAGLAGKEFSIRSKTLEVAEAETTFLYVPAGVKNIEITKGNDAKVYYSTNITAANDSYAGSGTVTTFYYDLYEALYVDSEPQKGSLVQSQTLDSTVASNILSYIIDKQYLVNTSVRGKCSYILEISAKDLKADKIFTASANICVKELPAKSILSKPQQYYTTDEASNIIVRFNIDNKNANTECSLSVIKNGAAAVFSTDKISDADQDHTIAISPVDSNRLLDVYTVSLKAKNAFDEAFSYDSYNIYVYNSNALKIMVNGNEADNLNLGSDKNLPTMTSEEILALNRKIYLTEEISINNKEYNWSNIADKITWEVSDDNKISLKYSDGGIYRDIEDYYFPSFLPGSRFLLQGKSSGNSIVTATHDLTGMEVKLNVAVDNIEEKLYIFQTYPGQKCEVSYTNGENKYKTVTTNNKGQLAVYEESGIKSDVTFMPENSRTYDYGVIKNNDLAAAQKSINDFGLYPQHNVTLPLAQYKVTFILLQENEKGYNTCYDKDVIIRGGVYRNGVYCPDAKINGISGRVDQVMSTDYGEYVLNFNPTEFITAYNNAPLKPEDNIEYIIELSFPGNSYCTKIVKIDNQTIKGYRNFPYGVYLYEKIEKVNPERIQNNVNIVSQTLRIDGVEQQMTDLILLEKIESEAVLNTELIFTGDYNKSYKVEFEDEYNQWGLFSNTIVKESYPFSNNIRLQNTFDLRKRAYYMKPGEKSNLYMRITAYDRYDRGSIKEIKLPKPIVVQNLEGIPKMDSLANSDLKNISEGIESAIYGAFHAGNTGNDNVKATLDFLKDYSIGMNSIRLEIEPTEDPLVYKGIIKFAAGALSRENPSGVYMVNDKGTSSTLNFMPGLSDVKFIKKGDFISKSKAQMNKNKLGAKDTYKTYGGGAYLECEIYYDIDSKKWKTLILKSDVYLGAGGGYYRTFNTWVGPVPVTAEFRTGLTGQIGLKTIANKVYDEEKNKYNITRDYVTELRPYCYIYGFGGFGADYVVASLKAGVYGQIDLDQRYLWLNQERSKKNGQKITISGETGVKFQASVLFVNYTKKYKLGGVSKSWTFNDFDEIEGIYSSKSGIKSKAILLGYSGGGDYLVLEPVSEDAAIEDRSYLDEYDRWWYSPIRRAFSADDITILQYNAYPNSNPVMTDDGMIMAYISDMDSKDINDTAVYYSRKGAGGVYEPGTQINASDYADTDVVIDGTGDKAAAAWTRIMTNLDKGAGEEAESEDLHTIMSSTEIMASTYNGTGFTTTRLTNNNAPDISPVVAANGNKAIVAWRSLYASDRENPLDFDGRDNIMYSIFDGAYWSEAKCLYDGSIDKVKALNAKMLSDGTSAITYQINIKDTENSEVYCAIIDKNGNIISNVRLTNDENKNENPQITSVVFPDEAERFVIGWNTTRVIDEIEEENIISLSAMDNKGVLYPQFEKEIRSTDGISRYNGFKFTKGAKEMEDLSLLWTEPKQDTGSGTESIYKDIIWGKKFIQESDGSISESPGIKLLELDDNNVADFFDSYVDSDTKEINFSLLISDYRGSEPLAKLAAAKSGYKNNLVVEETHFSRDDLMPGLDMPVLFSLYNDSAEPIKKVTINLAGAVHVFDEDIIKPGEHKKFTVLYTVPETIVNPDYSITAQFETSTDTKNGTLNMDIPDVGIHQIKITKEKERERIFSVQLCNNTFSNLTEGKHVVKIQVYDTPDFDNTPILTKTISDAQSLDMINDDVFIEDILLDEEAMKRLLDSRGEIPEGGARIYFNAVLEEMGNVIEDADISNDSDYVKIHSLFDKNNKPISITSLMESEADNTVVQVDVLNNSMNEIRNGNIIVNLKDQRGNIIETQQTYGAADAVRGLITIEGEETYSAEFHFDKSGAMSEVIYSVQNNNGGGGNDPNDEGSEKEPAAVPKIEPAKEYVNPFADVLESDWYYEAVKFANQNGLMIGTAKDKFSPGIQVTRGMFVTILYRMMAEPDVKDTDSFTDVENDAYYSKAVAWAYENGIVKGVSKKEFAPESSITREQLAVILYRYAVFRGYDTSAKGDILRYTDSDTISDYAIPAMQWALAEGLIKGRSEAIIAPLGYATRAEVAAILQRFLSK